ncbi:MAG: hypothetical protein H6566_29935 [Lewinellaceae bacterium]|nr:hypothetical protein [Lewinellaceae bacterium]
MDHVIQLYEEATERDIARLQEKRERIFRNLETFRLSLENLLGRPPDLAEDLEPFLQIRDYSGSEAEKLKAQELAFKIWLDKQEASFNIRPEKAHEALGYVPEPVEEVVAAWQAYNEERSQEPARYWSAAKQQFRALNVTKEEKEQIAARSRLTCYSEEAFEALEVVEQQVTLVNFLNLSGNLKTMITPGVIDTQFPLLARALKVKKDHRNVPLKPHQYYPDYEIFGRFPKQEHCFDE